MIFLDIILMDRFEQGSGLSSRVSPTAEIRGYL